MKKLLLLLPVVVSEKTISDILYNSPAGTTIQDEMKEVYYISTGKWTMQVKSKYELVTDNLF